MDTERIKHAVVEFLEAIGEDPNREGLVETPDRVARMCQEVLAGTAYTNKEIAEMYGKTFELTNNSKDMVLIKDSTT